MAKVYEGRLRTAADQAGRHAGSHAARRLDWRKRMSDNVAYALLAYTGLQIFVTMQAMHSDGMSILPYFALVVLVAAIIPACRRFERRWERLSEAQAADPALRPAYRRDQLLLWLLALGLPFVITGVFMGVSAII